MKDTRVDEIERCEDGRRVTFMVHLNPGWQLDGSHTFGEDTKAAIKQTMKRVQACGCLLCKVELSV
jgi:hypothetical protein